MEPQSQGEGPVEEGQSRVPLPRPPLSKHRAQVSAGWWAGLPQPRTPCVPEATVCHQPSCLPGARESCRSPLLCAPPTPMSCSAKKSPEDPALPTWSLVPGSEGRACWRGSRGLAPGWCWHWRGAGGSVLGRAPRCRTSPGRGPGSLVRTLVPDPGCLPPGLPLEAPGPGAHTARWPSSLTRPPAGAAPGGWFVRPGQRGHLVERAVSRGRFRPRGGPAAPCTSAPALSPCWERGHLLGPVGRRPAQALGAQGCLRGSVAAQPPCSWAAPPSRPSQLRVVSVSMERKQPGRLLLERGRRQEAKQTRVWAGLALASTSCGKRVKVSCAQGGCLEGLARTPLLQERTWGTARGTCGQPQRGGQPPDRPCWWAGSGAERAAGVWARTHGPASLPFRTHLPCDPTSRDPAPASGSALGTLPSQGHFQVQGWWPLRK